MFSSCTKDYEINLPPDESQLVIECYLEDGQPLRALITESSNLLDTTRSPNVLIQATVIITHGSQKDTLRPFHYVDSVQKRTYNFGSSTIVTANYNANTEYRIDVTDNQGRHAFGITRFLRPVAIDSLIPIYNAMEKAYCLIKFKDDPSQPNYYRLLLNRDKLYENVTHDVLIDNNYPTNNNEVTILSGHDYRPRNVINAKLYHLTYDYYLYLNTLQNAKAALINPFAVSGEIVSNIEGGLGVFTTLNISRKSVIVP